MISPSSLLHLESPYGEYTAAEASARDVLLTGLQVDTPYWPGQALGWLEQGMPVDAKIAELLASIAEGAHWPQRLRHRAQALLKSWRCKSDAS